MKVFVLSLHRCGTSSTTAYLSSLGYRARHCPRRIRKGPDLSPIVAGHEADLDFVFDTIKPVLDYYEATSDVPLPVMGRHLLANYRKAKFILLTRPVEDWISSVRRHCKNRKFATLEKVQYWHASGERYSSIGQFTDAQLERMFREHTEQVLDTIPPKRIFFGNLYDKDLNVRLAQFLGWEAPPFPHKNARNRHVQMETG